MAKQAVQAYIIDRVKTPSPSLLQLTKKCNSHPAFASVLATKIIANKQGVIQIISPEYITKVFSNKNDFQQKLIDSYNILRGIGLMHQNQWYIGQQQIKQVLAFNKQYGNIRILSYRFQPIQSVQNSNQNKQAPIFSKSPNLKSIETALKFGISKCFPEQCKITHVSQIDLWKWAYFICSQLLYNAKPFVKDIFQRMVAKESLKKQSQQANILPQKLPSIKQLQYFDNEIVQKFMNNLRNSLNPFPELRPSYKQMLCSLQCLISLIEKKKQDADHFKKVYKNNILKKIQKAAEQLNINIPDDQNLILNLEMKKKLNAGILKIVGRNVKQYKALYRAKLFQFNPQIFYTQCAGKSSILLCIQTVENGKIFTYIAPEIHLLEQNGLEGKYIPDQLMHSFIYSTKTQQFNKIITKDKAFKSVPLYGPIIGDGDIIIGNNPHSNYSYFPKSFQAGKKKTLIEDKKTGIKEQNRVGNRFSIVNYDAYQVIFKK